MTCRVLLVDDSVPLRTSMREAFEEAGGFDVVGEAADGAEGLRLVQELGPDVVVLDLAMPGLDGLDALRPLKQAHPSVKVCVVTLAGRSMQAEAFERGADAYFAKSDPLDYVVDACRSLCSP